MEIFVVLAVVATVYLIVNTAYLVGFSPYTQETKFKYFWLGMAFYWPSMLRRLVFQLFTGKPDPNIALVLIICVVCYCSVSASIGNYFTAGWAILTWGVIGFLVKLFYVFEEEPASTHSNYIS